MKRKFGVLAILLVLVSAVMVSCNLHEAAICGTWHSETKNDVRTVLVLKANKVAEYYVENTKTHEKTNIFKKLAFGDFADISYTWEADDTKLTIKCEIKITGIDETIKQDVATGNYDLSGITLTWNGVKFSRVG